MLLPTNSIERVSLTIASERVNSERCGAVSGVELQDLTQFQDPS